MAPVSLMVLICYSIYIHLVDSSRPQAFPLLHMLYAAFTYGALIATKSLLHWLFLLWGSC